MTAEKALHWGAWLDTRRLLYIILFASIFAMAVRLPMTPDLWWHLRCGQWMWEEHTILKEETFSYTALGTPWLNHSWLAQVVLYGLYRLGGWGALALAQGCLLYTSPSPRD